MTAVDLAAVCERHGLETVVCASEIPATIICRMSPEREYTEAATEEAAVCAALKARYGMEAARVNISPEKRWKSRAHTTEWVWDFGATELAAAVALADRLAGAGR